jgi:hypothetical protein
MAEWIFNENDVEENNFTVIPEGDYRVRVHSTQEKTSSTGKQMIEFVFEVSGYAGRVWDYLVLDSTDETARKRTNNKISQMAHSFGVLPQAVVSNPQSLVGKVGGCRLKHSQWNGETKVNVAFYLNAEKTKALPEWKNAGGSNPSLDIEVIDDDVEF